MAVIYLCSRIAKDAHETNNAVASALRAEGHKVFVPHEQHYNQIMEDGGINVPAYEIYEQDMEAMLVSDICVIVGRVGVDCAFEIGWFEAKGIPTLWFRPEGPLYGHHPMFYKAIRDGATASIAEIVLQVNAHAERLER